MLSQPKKIGNVSIKYSNDNQNLLIAKVTDMRIFEHLAEDLEKYSTDLIELPGQKTLFVYYDDGLYTGASIIEYVNNKYNKNMTDGSIIFNRPHVEKIIFFDNKNHMFIKCDSNATRDNITEWMTHIAKFYTSVHDTSITVYYAESNMDRDDLRSLLHNMLEAYKMGYTNVVVATDFILMEHELYVS